jgi:cytochrome oxidase Cu insertion factor (SCO1/SenC/PrrC family)/thiol-disulfide isomerase/thioredoxin
VRRLPAPLRGRRAISGLALLLVIAAGVLVFVFGLPGTSGISQSEALGSNPYLDPGTSLSRTAPDFTLTNQFGQPVSLHQFRGKVVLLSFNDSECTTLCPLTTTAMLDAKAMLGDAGRQVQLLGIEANPAATSLEDVWSYSELHGELHQWDFLTGSLAQLRAVWKAYAVYAEIQRGVISHTPALFAIGPQGQEAKVYLTQQSYAAVGQLGQILAREISNLLPDHPRVNSVLSYSVVPPITPSDTAVLPRAGGGTVTLGPSAPHLMVFFATWDRGLMGLAGELAALNKYVAAAKSQGLPGLTAVDEASVEPSSHALSSFLQGLPQPLAYDVAIDASGRLADGYEVQGAPWFVLTSATGQILWYWEPDTAGWPGVSKLLRYVRGGLAKAQQAPTTAAAIAHDLSGSPAPLAALHAESSRLLGAANALYARIRALRGYPIVINAWAPWCSTCRAEFALFAAASAIYGRRVAFLGADTEDWASDAPAFLGQNHVSYPSYQTSIPDLEPLAVIEGLPTTIFIDRKGRVVYVHDGPYDSEGTLTADIGSYALAG